MKPKDPTVDQERELVDRIIAADERALKIFYQTYGPPLLRFIRKRVATLAEAEDIYQETLLASLDALNRFSYQARLFSFLCAIARNKTADYYRKKKLKTVVFSQMKNLHFLVSEVIGPEARLEEKDRQEKIRQALARLIPRYQRVLKLKYFENLTIKEIAAMTDGSVKAVEAALFRARRAFAKSYLSL